MYEPAANRRSNSFAEAIATQTGILHPCYIRMDMQHAY